MNASSQARKKTRTTSPKAKKIEPTRLSRTIARTSVPRTRTADSQRRCRSVTIAILGCTSCGAKGIQGRGGGAPSLRRHGSPRRSSAASLDTVPRAEPLATRPDSRRTSTCDQLDAQAYRFGCAAGAILQAVLAPREFPASRRVHLRHVLATRESGRGDGVAAAP